MLIYGLILPKILFIICYNGKVLTYLKKNSVQFLKLIKNKGITYG